MFPSFSSLVADFEHWASQMDSDRPKTQHSWHQLSKQLSHTYGSKLHSFFLLNIVKTTVSLQKIHLPEGKWGVLHLRKPSPFWDPTWGNPITINFFTDVITNENERCPKCDIKCQLHFRCPDIQTPKRNKCIAFKDTFLLPEKWELRVETVW